MQSASLLQKPQDVVRQLALVTAVAVVGILHEDELMSRDALRELVCVVRGYDLVVRSVDGEHSSQLRDGQTCCVHVRCQPVSQVCFRHLVLHVSGCVLDVQHSLVLELSQPFLSSEPLQDTCMENQEVERAVSSFRIGDGHFAYTEGEYDNSECSSTVLCNVKELQSIEIELGLRIPPYSVETKLNRR